MGVTEQPDVHIELRYLPAFRYMVRQPSQYFLWRQTNKQQTLLPRLIQEWRWKCPPLWRCYEILLYNEDVGQGKTPIPLIMSTQQEAELVIRLTCLTLSFMKDNEEQFERESRIFVSKLAYQRLIEKQLYEDTGMPFD